MKLDEKRIKKTFSTDLFYEDDIDENKMVRTLEKWVDKYDWANNFYYYVNITEKFIHFFIKIKEKEIQLYEL